MHNIGSGAHLTCDIANALDAQNATLDSAADTLEPLSRDMIEFKRGYECALDAVRIAFGIPPRSTAASERWIITWSL